MLLRYCDILRCPCTCVRPGGRPGPLRARRPAPYGAATGLYLVLLFSLSVHFLYTLRLWHLTVLLVLILRSISQYFYINQCPSIAVCDILLRTYICTSCIVLVNTVTRTVVSSRYHISYLAIYHNIIAVRVYIYNQYILLSSIAPLYS
jgi:hypothetical protein